MTGTIERQPDKISSPRYAMVRGGSVQVFPPPYDLPDFMTANYDKNSGSFEIVFKYIGSREALARGLTSRNISLYIGEKSRRIYRIAFDFGSRFDAFGTPSEASEAILASIDELDSLVPKPNLLFNYAIIKTIVSTMQSDIFGFFKEDNAQ